MSRPLICPICHAAMLPGEDGSVCRRDPGHVFRIVAGARPSSGGSGGHCYGNIACPQCGEEMHLTGRGEWTCAADPRHVLEVNTRYRGPLIRINPLLDRAKGPVAPGRTPRQREPWPEMEAIGITTPLLPPVQSNAGDGTYCQPLGDIAPGGSKSGGKKKKKGGKKFTDDPWETVREKSRPPDGKKGA